MNFLVSDSRFYVIVLLLVGVNCVSIGWLSRVEVELMCLGDTLFYLLPNLTADAFHLACCFILKYIIKSEWFQIICLPEPLLSAVLLTAHLPTHIHFSRSRACSELNRAGLNYCGRPFTWVGAARVCTVARLPHASSELGKWRVVRRRRL